MIRLSLVSVGMVEDTGSVILVMRAADLERILVMEVGLLEGRAIAMEAEGVKAPRPLTHDLLLQVVERLGATIEAVRIHDFKEKTFFANLVLNQDGKEIEIDARPSDAIALALRTGAPVLVSEDVMATAGMDETDEAADDEENLDDVEPDDDGDEEEDEPPVVH